MFQKTSLKIGLSVLLSLLLLGTVLGVFALSGSAADVPQSSLTITVTDGAEYGKIYITVGGEQTELISGQTYEYPQGTHYTLSVEPALGYQAVWINGKPALVGNLGDTPINCEVKFVPNTFSVHYFNESLYSFSQDRVESYTYGENVTIINPSRTGYDLTGWKVYDKDPTLEGAVGTRFDKTELILGKDITPYYDCWLEPIFAKREYYVVRLDVVYDAGKPYYLKEALGYQVLSGPMDELISGADGPATLYAGYSYYAEFAYDSIQITNAFEKTPERLAWIEENFGAMVQNPNMIGNIVIRYYLPLPYAIDVDLNAGNASVSFGEGVKFPEHHVFDENTAIPAPSRVGYDFAYWEVSYLKKDGSTYTGRGYGDFVLLAKESFGEIKLKAIWNPRQYDVKYEWNGKDAADDAVIEALNGLLLTQYAKYTYDTPVAFPAPLRTGYTFLGWTVYLDGAEGAYNEEPLLTLPDALFSQAEPVGLTLKANWKATDYTVTLDGCGATEAGSESFVATFDAPFVLDGLVLPKRFGYKFLGYGTEQNGGTLYIHADGTPAKGIWDIAGDTTLYAIWEELPHVAAPDFFVDYSNEVFTVTGNIPDGKYEFTFGETTLTVVVLDGAITVNGQAATRISIPEGFFGQSVQVTVFGDGVTTSNNVFSLSVAARPKAPVFYEEIKDIVEDYTVIEVVMDTDLPAGYLYEFAISRDPDVHEMDLVWQDSPIFEDCRPGTVYYVFVRVKSSAGNYAHGQLAKFESTTYYATYVEQKVNDLLALKQSGDGQMVDALIADAIKEVREQTPSATFYEDLEAIYDRVVIEIVFARQQDEKIAELTQRLEDMKNSGMYSQESIQQLVNIYNVAIEQIRGAEQSDAVQNVFNTVISDMKEVKITHLQSGNLDVTSDAGMKHNTQLHTSRNELTDQFTDAVYHSIQLGNVSVAGSTVTLEEALRMLRSKDVMAWYSSELTDGIVTLTEFEGKYYFRLLLADDLRALQGLQIAYYNEKTGELEFLDTQRDGNCLIFSADRVADFVIMGDPTVNLTALIACLGCVALLQIIAIAFLVVRRKKGAVLNSVSILPAVALTIRVFPANGAIIVLALGVLVMLLQVILMYLLLTSDLFYFGKRTPNKGNEAPIDGESAEEDETAMTLAMQDESAEQAAFDDAFAEQPITDDSPIEGSDPEEAFVWEDSENPVSADAYEDLFSTGENGAEQLFSYGDGQVEAEPEELSYRVSEAPIFAPDEHPEETFVDEPTVSEETDDLFAFDDDEDLATGAPYYDEEVPLSAEEEEY
ncbi:MAG: InlB B-repeat-containing protein [Clostridia bacterium]|nr:InlB B-repeat-containing protein [Clostridia bacterium]